MNYPLKKNFFLLNFSLKPWFLIRLAHLNFIFKQDFIILPFFLDYTHLKFHWLFYLYLIVKLIFYLWILIFFLLNLIFHWYFLLLFFLFQITHETQLHDFLSLENHLNFFILILLYSPLLFNFIFFSTFKYALEVQIRIWFLIINFIFKELEINYITFFQFQLLIDFYLVPNF